MATDRAHLHKAESNRKFLGTIPDEYPDWLAIVAFYTAVHLVEALFAREGAPSHNHQQRNERLKRTKPDVWRHFRPLYHASKLLRYSDHVMSASQVRTELIERRLVAIENLLRATLG